MKRNSIFKLDILILSILSREDSYGYEIVSIIAKESNGILSIKEGVMYPILYKLVKAGMISTYDKKVGKKIRVYYHIEELGEAELERLKNDFNLKYNAIMGIVNKKEKDMNV